MFVGNDFFGITVTYSSFQISCQIFVVVMALYMSVRGIAMKSEYLVTSLGYRSPGTIDFGSP